MFFGGDGGVRDEAHTRRRAFAMAWHGKAKTTKRNLIKRK
jgi:hypothetical protein